jgi:hypothetical protein
LVITLVFILNVGFGGGVYSASGTNGAFFLVKFFGEECVQLGHAASPVSVELLQTVKRFSTSWALAKILLKSV